MYTYCFYIEYVDRDVTSQIGMDKRERRTPMLFWNLVVEPLFFAFVSGPFAILGFLLGLIL